MTRPSRRRAVALAVAAGSAALATCFVAGCDGSGAAGRTSGDRLDASEAPADAQPQAFCDAYGVGTGLSGSDDDLASTLHDRAGRLAAAGTPEDIPRSSRDGYVVYVAAASVATPDQAGAMVGDPTGDLVAEALQVSDDNRQALDAFLEYVAGTCFTARAS